ncbi:MAG: type II toxin-antitoxin system RelE family toxin [Halochromatium sp.]
MPWSVSLAWRIELTDDALKQLKKIGHTDAKRIRDYLRDRLQPREDPRQLGKPLSGQLTELWRYRVGHCSSGPLARHSHGEKISWTNEVADDSIRCADLGILRQSILPQPTRSRQP